MSRSMVAVAGVVAVLLMAGTMHADVPFDNPNYTYTQLWSAGATPNRAVWPDYNATAGKVLWRDNGSNGYVADFNPATKTLSNQVTFATGTVYEADFSAGGDYIFYQDVSVTSSLVVTGGTIQAYDCYRYRISDATTTKVFDISTIPAATVEALTSYVGDELGFYAGQGGSDNELLMSIRASTGEMEVVKYDITAKSFTNLTNSAQAEYDGQYLGTDTSKLLYWTESPAGHTTRGVSILSGGVETTIASTTSPDVYLSARWGEDHTQVLAMKGTGWSASDLLVFTYADGAWTSEDLTGPGWGIANGSINPGAAAGDGFIFSVRGSSTGANGLWYAEVPEPASMALLALGGLAVLRRGKK